MPEPLTIVHAPAAPPSPPRATTARVRRRAWVEPRIRFWWVAAAALVLLSIYLLADKFLLWRRDSNLINSGVAVKATVLEANEVAIKGHTEQADKPVRLKYDYRGQAYEVGPEPLEGRNEGVVVGGDIPIRIDPSDPSIWTAREHPSPLLGELVGGLIALPLGLLLLLVSAWLRRGMLRTWRDAPAAAGLVATADHTAIAPRSWSVQCTLAEGSDKRLFSVFAPAGADVVPGATIWLLFPSSGRPLAAAWFD